MRLSGLFLSIAPSRDAGIVSSLSAPTVIFLIAILKNIRKQNRNYSIENDKKVKEVAQILILGFSDDFYFSRIFKKIEGISLSELYSKNVHGV